MRLPVLIFFLLTCLAFVTPVEAASFSSGTVSGSLTVSGNDIVVFTSVGAPPAGYYDRVWVCTQTPAQIAQGFSGIYPVGVTAIPVQRFSDQGGTNTSGTVTLTTLGSGSRVYAFGGRFTNGSNAQVLNFSSALVFPDLAQTASLSPAGGAASILTGQTFSGIATGAQAGNSYNISIVSGGGGASINASTGAYTITAGPTGGLIHYKVWISAGGGYARSADVESNIAVSLSKKVTVTIPENNSSYPIKYTLRQGGVVIGTYIQPVGHSAYILQIDVGSNGGVVTMTATSIGVKRDGVSYIDDPSQEIEYVISDEILPDVPASVPPTPLNDIKKPSDTNSSSVWTPGNQSSDPAQQTDLLTNKVFREGVDKALSQGKTGVNDSSSVDLSAAPAATANVTIAGVNSLKGRLPLAPQLSAVGQSDSMSITLPMITSLTGTTQYTFTWNFSDWVQRLSWLRAFILGCISVWFFFAINKQLRNSVAN